MTSTVAELESIAKRVRSHIVRMVYAAQSGHPGGSLSATDLGVSLFWNHLRADPAQPEWPDRDRFILSKGHATPFLYSILGERGYFSEELFSGFRSLGSPEGGGLRATRRGSIAGEGGGRRLPLLGTDG